MTKRRPPQPSTHGVLIAGVHLTYQSRSTANRVRKVLRVYLKAWPSAVHSRDNVERLARVASALPGVAATDIVNAAITGSTTCLTGVRPSSADIIDHAHAVVGRVIRSSARRIVREQKSKKGTRLP